MSDESKEIDLIQLLKEIWTNRWYILKIAMVFTVGGIIISLTSAVQYTVTTTMIPQVKEGPNLGANLGGLASLAGINLGSISNSNEVPADLYPHIMNSVPFQKELLQTQINSDKVDEAISYFEYDQKFKRFSLSKFIRDLPSKIKNLIGGGLAEDGKVGEGFVNLTLKESQAIEGLQRKFRLTVNKKNGIVKLKMSMPEALVAAEMAKNAQDLLQKAITDFKIKRAQEQLDFTLDLVEEKRSEFETVQNELSSFNDRNTIISTATARNELERLESRYDLSLSVYTEISKQLESARLQVKEDTPSFSVLQPVVVPIERSKPRRALIVIAVTILGMFFGGLIVFIRPYLLKLKGS